MIPRKKKTNRHYLFYIIYAEFYTLKNSKVYFQAVLKKEIFFNDESIIFKIQLLFLHNARLFEA